MISYNTLVVLVGAALVGAVAGLAGSYAVLRRRALAGDALAHAALPGLCLAFLLFGSSSLPVLLLGALCTGVLGVAAISGLRRFTRIREDAAICIVLGVFFGAGIALNRLVPNLASTGSKAGLDSFFLGKTAGMTAGDVSLIAAALAGCSLLVLALYKEFKLTVFDARFALAQGWPVRRLEWLLMAFVAAAVVAGLPQVGAVMMAALLILPAAAARLWTDRFGLSVVLSTTFGALVGCAGATISLQYEQLPSGPIIVLVGAVILLGSLLVAPRRGLIARLLVQRQWQRNFDAVRLRFDAVDSTVPRDELRFDRDAEFLDEIIDHSATVSNTFVEVKSAARKHDSNAGVAAAETSRTANRPTLLFLGVGILSALLLHFWWSSLPSSEHVPIAWTMIVAVLTNVPCAVLGCFLLLRRQSLLGDTISHAVLPGIALAFFLSGQLSGLPVIVGALAVGALTALLTQSLRKIWRVPDDSSLGIVYTGLFAAGVILFTRFAAKTELDPGCLLYGLLEFAPLRTIEVAGWDVPRVLPTLLINCFYTSLFVVGAWKALRVTSIDSDFAAAIGIRPAVVHYLLMAFVAASAVTAFEALGSIVVVAMLIVPAATARLLSDRLGPMLGWSIAVAILSAIVGNITALELNTSAAGMIAVTAGLQFTLAVFFAPQDGLLSKWTRQFSLTVRIAAEDIVGMLYRAEEAAGRNENEFAPPTVWQEASKALRGFVGWLAIRRLMIQQEIHATAGGALELTDSGREAARSIVRSHRLWETYLGEKTELPLDHLHAPAERMEHFIGPELQERIAAELADADVDPHGREIPAEPGWRRPLGTPSLPEVHRSVPVPRRLTMTVLPSRANAPVRMFVPHSAGFWRTLLAFSGPGMMVSVGYMDPGNWATDIAGGAQFGYTLLSVILISNFMAMLLQYLALKLGVVTGRDLAQACRDHYNTPVAIGLWLLCELAIAACDLAEVIGSAIALNLLFGLPILAGVVLTAADVFVILFLQFKGFRYVEALVVMLIGLIGICFGYEMIVSHPDWLGVAAGLIPHKQIIFNPEMLYIAIGILGATVMPHNLYLHSSIIQTRAYDQSDSGKAKAVRFATIDSTMALFLAFFINAAILVLAAKAFHGTGHQDVADIRDAYQLLSPVLGASLASILFAVALLASGQNSTLTGTLAGQIVMEGFLHIHLAPWLRRLVTRLLAIVPAVIVITYWGEQYVGNLLILSQVVLSLQLPFAVLPLVMFTSDRAKMGKFANRQLLKWVAWIVAIVILALNALLFVPKEWIAKSTGADAAGAMQSTAAPAD